MKPDFVMVLHIVLLVTGLVGLLFSVAAACVYLIESRQLKTKRVGSGLFLKLPSLEALDRRHYASLFFGVILFSFGVFIGFFSTSDSASLHKVLKEPQSLLVILVCLLYWVVLGARITTLRRGQKIAIGTLLVFLLLVLTVAGSGGLAGFHKGP